MTASARLDQKIRCLLEGPVDHRLVLEALASDTWQLREAAVQAVSRVADAEELAERLLELVLSAGPDVRNSALKALGRLGPLAARAITDRRAPEPKARRLLAEAAGHVGDRNLVPLVARFLEDEDPTVRMAAAEALGRLGGDAAIRALSAHLHDEDLMVAAALVEALNRLEARLPFEQVAPLLQSRSLKRAGLLLAARSGDARSLGPILAALESSSPSLRAGALLALAELAGCADPEVTSRIAVELESEGRQRLLAQFLHEGPLGARAAALRLVALSPSPRLWRSLAEAALDLSLADDAEELLAQALATDWPEEIQETLSAFPELKAPVYRALARLESLPEPALPLLELARRSLGTSDPEEGEAAIQLLGRHGEPSVARDMVQLLHSEECRSLASPALADLAVRHPELGERLLAELPREILALVLPHLAARLPRLPFAEATVRLWESGTSSCQIAALEAAAHVSDQPWTRPLIESGLAHEDPEVRRAAVLACRGRSPPQRLWDLAEDPSPRVRSAVAYALSEYPSAAATERLVSMLPRESDRSVRLALLAALVRIGAILEEEQMLGLLEEGDPELLAGGLEVARCGPARPPVAGRARRLLEHPDWKVRLEAARTLVYHGERELALEALEYAVASERDRFVAQELHRLATHLERGV